MIKVGSDFSGVGAFEQALIRLNKPYKCVYACDLDKYARQTYIENYGEPDYYPEDVYEREIPENPLDIYMTSPPCQAFSLAGSRKGEDDHRGILFYNSHEFIQKNKPRYFIFENVKGLLSDDGGKTFIKWLDLLGGKSVNGNPVIFPHEESVPYHIYWQVLNAKDYGIPQNRERVFIIGIRDDSDNHFRFPKPIFLEKRLKDMLEKNVDEKYYLSDKMLNGFYAKHNWDTIIVKSATSKGYEEAKIGDSISTSHPNSNTRRGRVGNQVSQTIDTGSNQVVIESGTWRTHKDGNGFRKIHDGTCPTIPARAREDGSGQPVIKIGSDYKIRRLTPRECFRLMDFPDSFTWSVSDTQAYKQAGNSIVVNVLYLILEKLKLD